MRYETLDVLRAILRPDGGDLGDHLGLIFGSFSGVVFRAVSGPETGVVSNVLGPHPGE